MKLPWAPRRCRRNGIYVLNSMGRFFQRLLLVALEYTVARMSDVEDVFALWM